MKTLEQYLALDSLVPSILNGLKVQGIVEEGGELWLVFTTTIHRASPHKKVSLNKITWAPLAEMYETYIWTDMVSKGYMLVTIDNGWLVVSPKGEDYQVKEMECTCPHYLHGLNKQGKCKHLIFRDGEISYRRRQIEYRARLMDQVI